MATRQTKSLARVMVAPSVILLLIWMIVPLAMTLWFSFQYYNLLDPEVTASPASTTTSTSTPTRLLAGDLEHPLPRLLASWSSRSSSASLLAVLFDQDSAAGASSASS